MIQQRDRPSWVIEQLLNWRQFDCCGDQDLFPFQCCKCSEPLVLCYECDTLYTDLLDLTVRARADAETICPHCESVLGDDVMTSPRHHTSFDRWHAAGLDHLLIERPISELADMVVATASQIENWLSQGMRSTAQTRLVGLCNLAESIAVHFQDAAPLRDEGAQQVRSWTLVHALDWQRQIADRVGRAYALLGIAEAAVEQRRPTFANEQPEG